MRLPKKERGPSPFIVVGDALPSWTRGTGSPERRPFPGQGGEETGPHPPKLYAVQTSEPDVLLSSRQASSSEKRPSLLKNNLSSSLRNTASSNLEKITCRL